MLNVPGDVGVQSITLPFRLEQPKGSPDHA
jgi:hypothetical protein